MKLLIKICVCFLLTISTACYAANDNIKVFKLKNGHTVVVKEVRSNPIVTIDNWFKVGAVNENDQNNGVSHFLEHLLFKGTKKYKNGEIERILEAKGARFNAATSREYTHYYVTIASDYTKTGIELLADMLQNAQIPPEELKKERKVVQEEIRRSNDSFRRTLYHNLNDLVFKEHPYRYEVLGTHEIIENISREAILDYYHTHYVPENLTTVVVGDVDADEVLALVKENFKFENAPEYKKTKFKREPELKKPAKIIEKGDYNLGYLEFGYKGVPISSIKENYALDMLSSILSTGRSSRLYKKLKYEKLLVSDIDTGHLSMKDDSLFIILADFEPEKYRAVKNEILKEIEKVRTELVSDEELERVKTLAQRSYIYANESVENIAASIGYCMTISEDINCYKKHLRYVNNVTREDILKAAQKYLDPQKMALSVLLPETTKVNVVTKDTKVIKNSKKSVLSNGTTLITNKTDHNDIIALSVFLKGGRYVEPKTGLASLLAGTIAKSTKNRPYEQMVRETETSGIQIVPRTGNDYFEIKVKSTEQDFDSALDILFDVIKNPKFEEKYLEKKKKDILLAIRQSRDKPFSISIDNFSHLMYEGHPYDNSDRLLEKNIPSITRKEILGFYEKYFVPQNLIISVSGDVDHEELANRITSEFSAKPGKKPEIVYEKKYEPLKENKTKFQSKDTNAAWIVMGWPTEGLSDNKEYVTFRVIDTILSGGLSTRLHKSFREKQGLAYSVGSSYSPKIDRGHFTLYIGTQPDNIELVLKKFKEEMELLKTQKVNDKELEEAKQRIIGRFALSQETNQSKAYNFGIFEVIDKGFEFNYDFPELVKTITQEDIIKVANKYFNSLYVLSIVAPESKKL